MKWDEDGMNASDPRQPRRNSAIAGWLAGESVRAPFPADSNSFFTLHTTAIKCPSLGSRWIDRKSADKIRRLEKEIEDLKAALEEERKHSHLSPPNTLQWS